MGACSITGIPLLGGFAGKLYLMDAAVQAGGAREAWILAVLAASTLLNVLYFLRTVLTIYRRGERFPRERVLAPHRTLYMLSMACGILMIFLLGLCGGALHRLLTAGFASFM